MKDARVYSTIDGAKKCAKELKRLFDSSGFDFALNKCQSAVARAGDYRSWRDLEGALRRAQRPVEPSAFRKRLLAALPEPCRLPALAWLDKEPGEKASDQGIPLRWCCDVFPYLMATVALHRSRTPLLRADSGPGQRLREALVVGLLLNIHGCRRVLPRLEPDSLALSFRGNAAALFHDDARHSRFEAELTALTDAGVLDVCEDRVRVLSPDPAAVAAHVVDSRTGKAQHWGEKAGGELTNALQGVLASIGVRNELRMAGAIAGQGSDAYNTPSGPILELLSELAEEGEIETFAKAYGLFASIRPANARFVRETVPAKISSRYLARHRQLNPSKIMSWANAHPDWPETLKATVAQPAMFMITVDAIASGIAEHGT